MSSQDQPHDPFTNKHPYMLSRSVFQLLLAVSLITACTDPSIKPDPEAKQASPEKPAPKKVSSTVPVILHQYESDGYLIKFEYNDAGQLSILRMSKESDGGKERDSAIAKLIYKDNRPVEVQSKWRIDDGKATEITKLEYDNNGRIISAYRDLSNITFHFRYNDKGKLTSIGSKEVFSDEWDYDVNGNVIKKEFVKPHPAKAPKGDNHFTGTYSYDDNKNPFSHNSLGQLLYTLGFASDKHYQFLSQNNPVEIVDNKTYISRNPLPNYKSSGTKTTITFKNQYDKDGVISEAIAETKIQAFTNDKPDEYNKDRVSVRSTRFVCSLKKK